MFVDSKSGLISVVVVSTIVSVFTLGLLFGAFRWLSACVSLCYHTVFSLIFWSFLWLILSSRSSCRLTLQSLLVCTSYLQYPLVNIPSFVMVHSFAKCSLLPHFLHSFPCLHFSTVCPYLKQLLQVRGFLSLSIDLLTPPRLTLVSVSHLFVSLFPIRTAFTKPVKFPVVLFLILYMSIVFTHASSIIFTISAAVDYEFRFLIHILALPCSMFFGTSVQVFSSAKNPSYHSSLLLLLLHLASPLFLLF